jgi:phage baseplate assembly protein gpV
LAGYFHFFNVRKISYVINPSGKATAEFVGAIDHLDGDYNQTNGSHVVTGGDVTADGIGLKPHKHVEQGDGNVTSSSVA